jgi:signal transduction histidine kinase
MEVILNQDNGEILVTSEVGKGSKFTVILPCQIWTFNFELWEKK